MQPDMLVEIADRRSRKRAQIMAIAAIVFVLIHVVLRPLLFAGPPTAHFATATAMWATNAIALLLGLATGGGIACDGRVRALVNDEVARRNTRTAVVAGFWVAMATAMGVYVTAGFMPLSGREAAYAIVTASIAVALITFAWLELRAHRDA